MTHSLRGVRLLPVLVLLVLAPLAAQNGATVVPAPPVQAAAVQAPVPAQPLAAPPAPLPMARQIAVREGWLARRYQMLLPMMRTHKVGMWVVVTEEFHDDPLAWVIAPPRPYVGRRDIFVFADAGEAGLARIAITGYSEENVQRFFESPGEPAPADKTVAALVEKYKPSTIALSIGGSRGVTHSLTHDAWQFVTAALGPEASKRIVPAEPLIEELLDTRIPEEREHYQLLVEWTEHLGRRALSNEVITPGVTTVGDVRRWLYTQSHAAGFVPWFQPDVRVQRRSAANETSRGFLAVAKEAVVLEPGDVVHLDFGLNYMGLASDWQKMAYILAEGETDVPAGLKRAMANTNALQDALARISKPGKPAGDVHAETMAEVKAKGITAQIYSHPLGFQGHGLGPSIDMRSSSREPNAPPRPLRRGSYLAMELNTQTPVPEWNGQPVTVMAEDPVYLTEEGWRFFRPRQQAFYLVRPAAASGAGRVTYPDGLYAELRTNKGLIALQLEFERAPMTVANFVGLAEGTLENKALPAGAPFFDGTVFHRVVPGHVIQAGAPVAGASGPGYNFPNEIVPALSHGRAGMLGMANAGPHTNTCQFYVTLGDRSYLDGNYTLFGQVFSGMDVVNAIVQGDWVDHVRIVRVGEKAKAFKSDTATFRALVASAEAAVKAADEKKARDEATIIKKNWPGTKPSRKGALIERRKAGSGPPPAAGQTVVARYTGRFLDGRPFASSAEEGRPVPGQVAQPFEFVVGKTRLNPGLDEALAEMRKGEHRRLILQGQAGYGRSGYTSPQKPGEKRFVISPNTTLVYELEVLEIRSS
ncbi:MAG: M24 family metallopeptidase [Acidobacteria bacterium]|nr:MAG: M24 family metallopeptidase [Acidobacteriota bacterium]